MAKKTKKNKTQKYIDNLKEIKDKFVIVTGANSGLGFEISKTVLLKGGNVVMACRNKERAEAAKEKLIKETGIDKIYVEIYDQSDIQSVYHFADTIISKYPSFYALVLNAGVLKPKENIDEFNISNTYRTNFIGLLALVDRLKPFLDEAKEEKRIIIQGSLSSYFHKYKSGDEFIYGKGKQMRQYALSKLCCSNLYVYLKNNNENPYVKYLLAEPGVAITNIYQNFKKWFKNLSLFFLRIFTNDALTGSLATTKLICDICANGDYYRPAHFFHSRGLPIKSVFKKEFINYKIIEEGREIVKMYERSN